MFFFGAYTSKEQMEKALGFKWSKAPQLVDDSHNAVVFVEKGQIKQVIRNFFYLVSPNKQIITFHRENAKVGVYKFPDSEQVYLDIRDITT
ncbi:hypothetical protein D3C73_524750 [compost metagenome]